MNIRQKIQSLIIALILSNILTGCYKDEGSYDYGILNEISVQSPIVGSRFAVDRYDEIEINPVLDFSGSIIPDDQLEFRWEMYIDDWANAEAKATVLGYEKNLKTIISRPASTDDYALMLTVTNKENGTSYQFKYALSVQPSVLSGIMVLQENRQGEMRLDYLASTNAEPAFAATRHLKDVYKTANNGANLSGKPLGVSYSVLTKSSYEPQVKNLYIWTDREVARTDATDFTCLYSNTELFQVVPEVIDIKNIIRFGSNYTFMVNNGKAHCLNQQTSYSHGYKFSRPLKGNSSLPEPMRFSKWIYQPDMFPSQTGYSAILFDEIGQRFVKVSDGVNVEPPLFTFNEQTTSAKAKFDVNNIGKDLIFMGKGNAGQGFAVVGDDTQRNILRMRFNIANTVTDADGNTLVNEQVYNIPMAKYDLSAATEGNQARLFDLGRYANTLIYATDRNMYTYDFSAKRATRINDDFPEGEEITAMKIYNVETYTENLTNVSGTLLYVATWNGEEGKIYEFALNRTTCRLNNRTAASGNLKEPLNVFGGMERIVDICVKPQGRGD